MTKKQVERYVVLSGVIGPMLRHHIIPDAQDMNEYMELWAVIFEEYANNPEQFEENMREWGFSG